MRGTRKVGPAALAITVTVVATLVATPGTGTTPRAGRTLAVQNLAPGLTLTRINDPAGPYQVYVLNMDPSQPSTLDVAVPGGEIGSYAKPSQIGAAHGALAAINGDFSVNPGRPLHALATDGTLTQSALQNGPSFALSKDETQSFMADHSLLAGGHRLAGGRTFAIADTNGQGPRGRRDHGLHAVRGLVGPASGECLLGPAPGRRGGCTGGPRHGRRSRLGGGHVGLLT